MNWLIARLKEKSTWLALFTFASLFGMKVEPELREHLINAILAVAAAAAFIFREDIRDEQANEKPPIRLVSPTDRIRDLPDFCRDTDRGADRDSLRPGQLSGGVQPASETPTRPNTTPGFNDR